MGRAAKIAVVAVLAGLLTGLVLVAAIEPPAPGVSVFGGAGADASPEIEKAPERCRSVTEPDPECAAAWAASRRRFFGQQDGQP